MEGEEIIGSTGELVDLFKKELTQDEWNAIAIVHKLKNRLNLGIRFDWSKSIDVRSETTSQIIDESVFLEQMTPVEEISILIDNYWKFDEQQQPMSSWHDKQDLLKAVEDLLKTKSNGTTN